MTSRLLQLCCAALLAFGGAARADDIDLYINQDPNTVPPLTVLALDLRTDPNAIACNDILGNPDCDELRDALTVQQYLGLVGQDYGSVRNLVLALTFGQVDLNDYEDTDLNALPAAALTTLNTIVGSADKVTNDALLLAFLQNAINNLVNNRLAIMLSHDNRNASGSPVLIDGKERACNFADMQAVSGKRGETLQCSNGAYLFLGFVDLVPDVPAVPSAPEPPSPPDPNAPPPDPNAPPMLPVLDRVLAKIGALALPNAMGANAHPFQGKEVYAELIRYLKGGEILNGHLGYLDYADSDPNNNLDQSQPLLSWDTSVEASANTDPAGEKYRSALDEFGVCDSVNLINVLLSDPAGQDDSDTMLLNEIEGADRDGNGTLTYGEVAASAEENGILYKNSVTRIKSFFIVNSGGASTSDFNSTINTVVSAPSLTGLFGLGTHLSEYLKPVLVTDASMETPSVAINLASPNQLLQGAYFASFRPEERQRVAWNGNLKRLRLVPPNNTTEPATYRDARGARGVAEDGRIAPNALSFWTSPASLPSGVNGDGRRVTRGGVGAVLPGCSFDNTPLESDTTREKACQGDSPGRGNSEGKRQLYYDDYEGSSGMGNVDPDNATVRTDLMGDLGAVSRGFKTPPGCFDSLPSACTPDPICTPQPDTCTPQPDICTPQAQVCTPQAPICVGTAPFQVCTPQLPICTTPPPVCVAQPPICNTPSPICQTPEPPSECSSIQLCSNQTVTADQNAQELLLHARGFDVGPTSEIPARNLATVTGRPWWHGGVLHSKPLAIHYGGTDVRIFYGATDGTLRQVRDSDGKEVWGFMPRVLMKQQKILRDNQTGTPFPYGVDGAPQAIVIDRSSGNGPGDGEISSSNDHVYVYFGLRRGGNYYYALDVTNPDAAPKLMWRIGPDGLRNTAGAVAGSSGWYSEMAQAFSKPKPARLRFKNGGANPEIKSVLVFTAGYNGGRDALNNRLGKDFAAGSAGRTGSDDSVGNAVYIVDAVTGELIWKAAKGSWSSSSPFSSGSRTYSHPLLEDSMASDTALIDTNGDGYADRLYVGDTGGRVWRGDFADIERDKWSFGPQFSVGRHNMSGVADDRRFFFAPDYVAVRGTDLNYDAVVIASGDREDPLNRDTVNWLYTFRDPDTTAGQTFDQIITRESDLPGQTDFTDLTNTCGGSAALTCADSSNLETGWRLKLGEPGEKALSQPLVLGGTVFLTTFIPPGPNVTQCVPSEGGGRIFGVALRNSRKVFQDFENDGDGDGRSTRAAAPGLTGEVGLAGLDTLTAGAQTFKPNVAPYVPIYWRERRGDDEPVPKN